MAKTPKRNTSPTAYRMKPGKPAAKSSKSGYGHKSSTTGSVDAQGSGRNAANRRRPG